LFIRSILTAERRQPNSSRAHGSWRPDAASARLEVAESSALSNRVFIEITAEPVVHHDSGKIDHFQLVYGLGPQILEGDNPGGDDSFRKISSAPPKLLK
jgi:hypothetical protein